MATFMTIIADFAAALLMLGVMLAILGTLGLGPPILIRYALFRRQLRGGEAFVIATVFLLLNSALFFVFGVDDTMHVGLILLGVLSYLILRRVVPGEVATPH